MSLQWLDSPYTESEAQTLDENRIWRNRWGLFTWRLDPLDAQREMDVSHLTRQVLGSQKMVISVMTVSAFLLATPDFGHIVIPFARLLELQWKGCQVATCPRLPTWGFELNVPGQQWNVDKNGSVQRPVCTWTAAEDWAREELCSCPLLNHFPLHIPAVSLLFKDTWIFNTTFMFPVHVRNNVQCGERPVMHCELWVMF